MGVQVMVEFVVSPTLSEAITSIFRMTLPFQINPYGTGNF